MNSEYIKQLNELLNNYKELLHIQKHPSVIIAGDENITDIIRLVEKQIKSYCEHLKTKEEIKNIVYICDEQQCEKCHVNDDICPCYHTFDIRHAKNFKLLDIGIYEEKTDDEKISELKAKIEELEQQNAFECGCNEELVDLQNVINLIADKYDISLYEDINNMGGYYKGVRFKLKRMLTEEDFKLLRKYFGEINFLLTKLGM